MKKEFEYTSMEELVACKKTQNINDLHEESLTRGERMADKMADFAGSWTFIMIFMGILFLWITMNSVQLLVPVRLIRFHSSC